MAELLFFQLTVYSLQQVVDRQHLQIMVDDVTQLITDQIENVTLELEQRGDELRDKEQQLTSIHQHRYQATQLYFDNDALGSQRLLDLVREHCQQGGVSTVQQHSPLTTAVVSWYVDLFMKYAYNISSHLEALMTIRYAQLVLYKRSLHAHGVSKQSANFQNIERWEDAEDQHWPTYITTSSK